MTNATGERDLAFIQEVLEMFPEIARKERREHMMVNDPQMESVDKHIISDRKPQPGVMAVRSYTYASSKGVVFGPTEDMAHISHDPIGCGQYSRVRRRNYYTGVSGVDSFGTLDFTSDFQERDIVFGGDKKLTKLIEEMEQLFPLTKGITIQSECPMDPIDDDVSAVANTSSRALDKPVIPVRCEDFHGVSQSLGHHIASDMVHDWMLNNREGQPFASTPYDVATIDGYNIDDGVQASRILLEKMGLHLMAQWSGGGTLVEMENTPFIKPNLAHCHHSMNYIARHMEERHQISWMEYSSFGPAKIAESLCKIASQSDNTIHADAEAMIAKYEGQIAAIIAKYRPRLEGRRVLLYMGGLRPYRVIGAYENLGVEIIAAGYGFARNDGYSHTLPGLKEDTLLFDGASGYKLEAFVRALKLNLIGSGIKEKYIFQKMGVPFHQMHSWDYSDPYHGCDGFTIFARDMDIVLNSPVWSELTVPWLKSVWLPFHCPVSPLTCDAGGEHHEPNDQ